MALLAARTKGSNVKAGNTPTSRQMPASRATGAFMPKGGSCGCMLGMSRAGPLKNTSCTSRTE